MPRTQNSARLKPPNIPSLPIDAHAPLGMEQNQALLSAIVNASDDAILSKTLDGIVTSWNPAAERMFGYTAAEIIGKPKTLIFPPDRLHEEEVILRRLRQGIGTDHFETVRLHKNGTPVYVSITISPIRNSEGEVIGASTIARDITMQMQLMEKLHAANAWQKEAIETLILKQMELRETNELLEALATTDGLTGIKNHRALYEALQEEYDRSLRYDTPLSVLMLDVDKFKEYNDTFGHPAGDVVLRKVAQVLQETARTSDVVARYGGEEFVILLPGTGMAESKAAAERFRHAIETAAWEQKAITVSVGIATLTPDALHPDALLANADTALYRSKHRGRNCVTHAAEPIGAEMLDTEAARWYDDLLQKLLAAQSDTLDSVSEQAQEKVRAYLQEQSGTPFDPRAVAAFLTMLQSESLPDTTA